MGVSTATAFALGHHHAKKHDYAHHSNHHKRAVVTRVLTVTVLECVLNGYKISDHDCRQGIKNGTLIWNDSPNSQLEVEIAEEAEVRKFKKYSRGVALVHRSNSLTYKRDIDSSHSCNSSCRRRSTICQINFRSSNYFKFTSERCIEVFHGCSSTANSDIIEARGTTSCTCSSRIKCVS